MSNVEVYVHDAVDRDVEFLTVFLIKESSILAQPMPDKSVILATMCILYCSYTPPTNYCRMLAMCMEVESATAQLLMHSEKVDLRIMKSV